MNGTGAFIAGRKSGPGEGLADICADVGFAFVARLDGIDSIKAQLPRTPLCFGMFPETADPGHYGTVLKAIRGASLPAIKFMPLIYFCETPSPGVIRQCAALGFDDVLTMPFTPERVRERLSRQIGASQFYYRTSDFFGPDRRREFENGFANRRGGGRVRRIEILRSPASGVALVRDEIIDTSAGA